MATGSDKSFFVAQCSDDVFELAPTQVDVPQALGYEASNNLSAVTVHSKSLNDKEHPQALGYEEGNNLSAFTPLSKSLGDKECASNESLLRCEKGQKARDHYRSSGYGTGSSDNASVRSVSNLCSSPSQEAVPVEASAFHEEVSAVPPQSNHSPIVSIEVSECVENDFKPKNWTSNPSRMNALVSPAVSISPQQDFANPLQANLTCSNSAMAANSQSTGRVENMTGSGLVSSSLTTKDTDAVTGHNINDTNKKSPLDNHVGLSISQRQVQTNYHQDVQERLDLHYSNRKSVIMAQYDQTQANGISQATLSQQQTATGYNNTAVVGSTRNTDFQLNLQDHLSTTTGDTKGRQSHISPSASGSRFDNSQNIKPKPPLIRQNVLQHQNSETENGCPTNGAKIGLKPLDSMLSFRTEQLPNFHDLVSSTSFYLSNITSASSSSCECAADDDLLNILNKSAKCKDDNCENPDCLQIRKNMMVLQDMNKQVCNLTGSSLILLHTMAHHAFCVCSHPRCSFPWCWDNMDSDNQYPSSKALEDHFLIMKQRIENYSEYCSLSNSYFKEYMKFSLTFPHDSLPVEGQDWVKLFMLHGSRKTLVALPVTSDLPSDFKYWVIKKVPLTCDLDHWGVYSKLREVQHSSIATMLWAAKFDNYLVECSVFEDLSLPDFLKSPSPTFGLLGILNIMLQLTSATRHLHDLGIVYLYWMSKNILVKYPPGDNVNVKICNLSRSVLVEKYDGGQLYLMLPVTISMPELRNKRIVKLSSDVWGLGCLLNELVTGKPVWHEHRHQLDVDLLVMLKESPVPDTPTKYPELVPLFQACWEIDCTKRASVNALRDHLTNVQVSMH